MLRLLTAFFFLLLTHNGWSQTGDSAAAVQDTAAVRRRPIPAVRQRAPRVVNVVADTAAVLKDTLLPPYRMDTMLVAAGPVWNTPDNRYLRHPYYRFANPAKNSVSIRQWRGKEGVFYSLIALLIFFALIRNGFGRYISDLSKSFFRTTVRQRQIKEQLLQSPLPSLLLNGFFVLSIGMFAALALQHYGLGLQFNFWILYFYCIVALLGMYLVKFVLLKFIGWVSGAREAANTYIFVIFSANKLMGIALLPILLVLGFNSGLLAQVTFTLGLVVIAGLFAYRFFLFYTSVQRQLSVSFFHFLMYLAAFEIVPLLLINKLLLRLLS